jgi:hypothetical protein
MPLRVFLLIVFAVELVAQPPAKDSVFQRVCRWLGLKPDLYSRLATRGGDFEPAGERLMLCDLKAKRISPLWVCGECWSPILLSEGMAAVAKSDGIWRVPLDGSPPTEILSATNLGVLVGVSPTDSQQLLVLLVDGGGASTTYVPKLADLKSGKLAPAPSELGGTYRTGDLAAFPRPDALRGDRLLSTSQDPPLRMFGATYMALPTPSLGDNEELLPWSPVKEGVEQFRPIWVGRDSIVFLERGK